MNIAVTTWKTMRAVDRIAAIARGIASGMSYEAIAISIPGASNGAIAGYVKRYPIAMAKARAGEPVRDDDLATANHWSRLSCGERLLAMARGVAAGRSYPEIAAEIPGCPGPNVFGALGCTHPNVLADLLDEIRRGRSPVPPTFEEIRAAGRPRAPTAPKVVGGTVDGPVFALFRPEPINPDRVVLLDRRAGQCAYPLWSDKASPRPEEQFVCGDPVEVDRHGNQLAYCAEHARRCLVTPPARPKRGGRAAVWEEGR